MNATQTMTFPAVNSNRLIRPSILTVMEALIVLLCQTNDDPCSAAGALFNKARSRAALGKLKAVFVGERPMPTLSEKLHAKAPRGQHARGCRTVEIKRIIGSESKPNDFDAKFNPLHNQSKFRWMRIAELNMDDAGLPAVDLFQVGDEYYVRDGHHRVSVARTLGQEFIEAHVTVLEL